MPRNDRQVATTPATPGEFASTVETRMDLKSRWTIVRPTALERSCRSRRRSGNAEKAWRGRAGEDDVPVRDLRFSFQSVNHGKGAANA